jgi:hypothetical protein
MNDDVLKYMNGIKTNGQIERLANVAIVNIAMSTMLLPYLHER